MSEILKYWRLRGQLLRLEGSNCQNCGTKHFPPQRTCPNCGFKSEKKTDNDSQTETREVFSLTLETS